MFIVNYGDGPSTQVLLAQWCSEILNRSNCAGALHWSDIFVRRELRGAKVNSDCVRKKSLVNYLLKGPERVEQEASEIIRKQREAEKWKYVLQVHWRR